MSLSFAVLNPKLSDMSDKELVFAGYSEDNAIFYTSFSALAKTWPTQIAVGGDTYAFNAQEALDLNESGAFAGRASYKRATME